MLAVARSLGSEIKGEPLAGAALILAPLVLMAALSGDAIWLRVAIVAISTFIAMQQSGLAPLGVLLHGAVIVVGFIALLFALTVPPLFVLGCSALAALSILLTTKGAKLRSLGNFTFIPVVYLAIEISNGAAPTELVGRGLSFLPFAAAALVPTLALSVALHLHECRPGFSRLEHFRRIVRGIDLGERKPWKAATIAVVLAVAIAATVVEWSHLPNAQWVIWSAASVVTGEAGTSRLKLRDRAVGALIGVLAGIGLGQFIPHDAFYHQLASLAAVLTLVGFRTYVIGFGLRCAFIALALIAGGQTAGVAAERVVNVLAGGVIGIALVLGVELIATSLNNSTRWRPRTPPVSFAPAVSKQRPGAAAPSAARAAPRL